MPISRIERRESKEGRIRDASVVAFDGVGIEDEGDATTYVPRGCTLPSSAPWNDFERDGGDIEKLPEMWTRKANSGRHMASELLLVVKIWVTNKSPGLQCGVSLTLRF
ncbi:uncharacterized protein STEHIDRAFT_110550 [Stereum hirsutum FP-91666 SS1]|uniref:uncharacterized protein n=1 Tax=Stereum hirsutum (strain FP-91666) TaxID=721885 RepID=UPI000440AD72|nr:uncharacterized protein STEHIDRAFT_110550 [Stereum hirsutum FP-91666 SS1]EIM87310.1 hypothetical protein STEHIDRAFT_110550 [Stereum hirsutum FP-91666 SS1]